ncbi:FliM/FliN family flagellar motor switch protein [Clostridioides mangenotii]|uniref:FliM/FliN family flagellar motor switch protein n=1 Tax=Metaclostridioides mangenotii TaxID=1540 RepID=UPI001C0F4B06|nr:FliM/FliN family flagellar motor switch protein [Clostridioides mangenotii]MBU5307823.1 FliM/FliN family flagellar motor switch protein [Clostridioides mangenotii]MCR1953945.1 FliM/FliN family flagellar motor switch protein [Clostridioides mangenotii]
MDSSKTISNEEKDILLKNETENMSDDVDFINENLSRILDVNLELSVIIGRTRMKLKEILSLQKGSLIELDALVDQDVEILIDDKVFAYGKVVVVDLNFGVKITNIVEGDEWVKTFI